MLLDTVNVFLLPLPLLIALLVSPAAAASSGGEPGRIVNGSDAEQGQFPYMVSINIGPARHSCGGTILDQNSVLTAAHCCTTPDFDYEVVAGEHRIYDEDGTEQRVLAAEIIMHEEYNNLMTYNDLCVLQLQSSLEFNELVRAVSLPPSAAGSSPSEAAGAPARVIGWGDTEFGGEFSNVLQYADVYVVSDEDCLLVYGYIGSNPRIVDSNICAADFEEHQDACQGDSGGPMMCDFSHGTGFQCGITSWGKECAKEPFSGVYTQVSYFNEWIEEVMARNDDSAIS